MNSQQAWDRARKPVTLTLQELREKTKELGYYDTIKRFSEITGLSEIEVADNEYRYKAGSHKQSV